MNADFQIFPGGVLVIDLRKTSQKQDWSSIVRGATDHEPYAFALWICPAHHWASDQKALIAAIQTVRTKAGLGGQTGPTALIAPDFMPLDWIGPVRALAIPIYGTSARIEWRTKAGDVVQTDPLLEFPSPDTDATFIRLHGRRPKVDLL